jgi:CRP-like cAMP-binding protein
MKTTPHWNMHNSLTRKLAMLAELSIDDRQAIDNALIATRFVPPKQTLIYEGDTPEVTHVVLDGFACRSKHLADGGRQIVAYVLPGDFGAFHGAEAVTLDYSVTALSGCLVAEIPRALMLRLLARAPITQALWRLALQEASILRAWITNNGRRDSESRIAHLVCELYVRLRAVGRVEGNTFQLPLSQEDIADTAGLSTVHTNRCLQSLRSQSLIRFKGGALEILNPNGLAKRCSFNPGYLAAGMELSFESATVEGIAAGDIDPAIRRLRPQAFG